MSHSPGEWVVDAQLSICAGGKPILDVYGESDESLANAQLASAAPDLFEAAVAVLEGMWERDERTERIWRDLVKPFEAAVKKVRGW